MNDTNERKNLTASEEIKKLREENEKLNIMYCELCDAKYESEKRIKNNSEVTSAIGYFIGVVLVYYMLNFFNGSYIINLLKGLLLALCVFFSSQVSKILVASFLKHYENPKPLHYFVISAIILLILLLLETISLILL